MKIEAVSELHDIRSNTPAVTPQKSVPYPEVPSYLKGEREEAQYVLLHYWDSTDFSDSSWAGARDVMEEGFARFITIGLLYPEKDTSRKAVSNMMRRISGTATPEVYDMMIGLADKYLYDPNSPLRDEDMYITVLESQIADPGLDEIYKVAPRERLRMAMKNRPGEKANDFSYTTSDGKRGTLYGTDADFLLLFFHNPGCPACRDIRDGVTGVMAEPGISEMARQGRFKILAVYPDADLAAWNEYDGEIPATWINAYDGDQSINGSELYDLRAIPSLYLLDRHKTVLLKDFIDPQMLSDALTFSEAE